MNIHYFDNAATTKISEECLDIVSKYGRDIYFNPSANYLPAVSVHNEITAARENLLKKIGAFSGNLLFVSSGSEANNQALICSKKRKNSNIVISAVEHPAVYNTAMYLRSLGYEIRLCPVDTNGCVKCTELANLVDLNTSLVSIMHVNNETGAINDIKSLVKLVKGINKDTLFHSDGVQALGKINVNVTDLNVDLYTISGHKISAPKGIAGLYIKKGVVLQPLIYGGGQEGGLRSSTENVSGILAFEKAINCATDNLVKNTEKYEKFNHIIREELSGIEGVKWISDDKCAKNIVCFAFNSVRGEVLQHALEAKGFLVGTGSACSSRRSHERIPKALGLNEYADGMIRISFGVENTENEVHELAKEILVSYEELKKYVGK